MEPIYVTVAGKKKLEDRLNFLISRRAGITEQIRIAREYGDLRENAEYAAAREDQNNLESEIEEIKANLANLKVFSYAKAPTDKVGIGSKVTVEVNKRVVSFVITGTIESDLDTGYLSYLSPIGRALMDAKVGSVVTAVVPAGKINYTIKDISRV